LKPGGTVLKQEIGDAVSRANWSSKTFGGQDAWSRIVTVIKETLEIDECIAEDRQNRLKWAADTFPVTFEMFEMFEMFETSPYP
jgi:hypothetical protein